MFARLCFASTRLRFVWRFFAFLSVMDYAMFFLCANKTLSKAAFRMLFIGINEENAEFKGEEKVWDYSSLLGLTNPLLQAIISIKVCKHTEFQRFIHFSWTHLCPRRGDKPINWTVLHKKTSLTEEVFFWPSHFTSPDPFAVLVVFAQTTRCEWWSRWGEAWHYRSTGETLQMSWGELTIQTEENLDQ